jgi:DUF2075 family protein
LQDKLLTKTAAIAEELTKNTYPIYVTRNLEQAKEYVRERYYEDPNARFGMLASARDKILPGFGVLNQFQDSRNMKIGPWFSEGENNEHSCRNLIKPATEFQSQGLELDFTIVCWGGDLVRVDGKWSDLYARKFRAGTPVKDPLQLRINSYRVLLTRGRDGMIIFVPEDKVLDETYAHLLQAGITELH